LLPELDDIPLLEKCVLTLAEARLKAATLRQMAKAGRDPLPPIATALDAIIERFGVEKVAEVTGRTRRLTMGADNKQKLQSRTPRSNLLETQAFMDGDKRILVFSDAGGTGRSYHADLHAKNQHKPNQSGICAFVSARHHKC
jgi:C-terminal domain on Strawberry notch homologue